MLRNNQILGGSYSIEGILGSGGMGNVYLARDLRWGGRVAVKERLGYSSDADQLLKEAEIMGRLRHKGLPRLLKAFRERGSVYLIMDYVEGKSLKKLLSEKGRLSEDEVLSIAGELAEILRYLHGLHPPVYYLDLKPSNILIDGEGRVRLIDFGAAKERGAYPQGEKKPQSLTRGYAAPEQYLGKPIDERTDLYALGVTLHFLLTGKNPNEPPFLFEDVRKLNPKITKTTAELVRSLLEPSPEDRLQSAEALLSVLKNTGKKDWWKRLTPAKKILCGAAAALLMLLIITGTGKEGAGKAEEIIFSLAPGNYEGYQLLFVEYDHEKGRLYYTTDGSAPTRESPVYVDGIVLSRPEVRVRAALFSFDGETVEESGDYKIHSKEEIVEILPDSEVGRDIYYALSKRWTEPLYNYELAELRSLPSKDLTEENEWLIAYLPFLRNPS